MVNRSRPRERACESVSIAQSTSKHSVVDCAIDMVRDGRPAHSPSQRAPVAEDGAGGDTERMNAGAPATPQQRIAAERARRGDAALMAGCVALLGGGADDVDDSLITVLGGEAAPHVLAGGEGGRAGYWPRVWAARGLLHAWDDHADHSLAVDQAAALTADHAAALTVDQAVEVGADRAAEADAAIGAIVGATRDPAWRVREMAAKVVARHRIGAALDAVAALRDDPVPRVRAAAGRAVVTLTASRA
jgi:hypothetical protein